MPHDPSAPDPIPQPPSERDVEELYGELHRVAAALMTRERTAHTLGPTALVGEAWLRLAGSKAAVHDRAHFLRLAARAMRNVLVDHARARGRAKRGGESVRVPLDTALAWYEEQNLDVLAIDEALGRLADVDGELVKLVELRFFAGLTLDETAAALGVSVATVERGWKVARLWLARDLGLGGTE